jgi:hypothetical protein
MIERRPGGWLAPACGGCGLIRKVARMAAAMLATSIQ